MTRQELSRQLAGVPESTGVYLWKSAAGEVLYVGKAKDLRSRMRSYLGGRQERPRIPLLMDEVSSFDYVVTDGEVESLILEVNLIKQYRPRFNVDYKDDKSYPFIALTLDDPFPAIKYTRERHRKGVRYFGPYTDARAARETIEAVRRVHPICRASCVEWKRMNARGGQPGGRACFDHHVGKGPGPCVGAIGREEYGQRIAQVARFLSGRQREVPAELERQMREASAQLDYERAARLRNSLEAVRSVLEKQKVVSPRPVEADVLGIHREETIAAVQVLVVREGRILVVNDLVLDRGMDVGEAELVEGLLTRYYSEASHVPRQVVLPALPEEVGSVEVWLSGRAGRRVRLRVPARGDMRGLLDMASANARHALARYKHRTRYDEQRTNDALLQLESALSLPSPPMRIECFDISTLHGRHSVGSMVVFTGGRPDPASYRRFRVRFESGQADDFAMMREVLARRFSRHGGAPDRFADRPDLVIVDGGKGQLSAALAAVQGAGACVPVAALSKREEELFVPGSAEPVVLPVGSPSLHLVKRIRDEAHRFAVEYHRELRRKAMTASVLDTVPGVGPKRRQTLLREFGSVKRMRQATVEQLAAVPGIPREVAEDLYAALRPIGDAAGRE